MLSDQCFKDLTLMISDVIDQVGLDDSQHGKRVGYMAWKCSGHLDIPNFSPTDILVTGLLHDIGVSSSRDHELLVTQMDWDKAQAHCEEGTKLLRDLPFYSKYIPAIRHHHTKWPALSESDIDEGSKLLASLVFLADRADALLFQYLDNNPDDEPIHAMAFIQAQLTDQLSDYFAPVCVDAFIRASSIDAFWFNLESAHLDRYIHNLDISVPVSLDIQATEAVALILAAAVDAKSPFTADHSIRVGKLACYIAQQAGLPDLRCQQLRIAGYLHDIGKLHIPDKILDKQGPLNAKETIAMHRHGFEAKDILERVEAFREIALWSCQHHEFLDGSGYPYHLTGEQIPLESRILTIADIFQALAQKRPYRDSMPLSQVIGILTDLTTEGKIDANVLEIVYAHQKQCWTLATAADSLNRP
ncbi:HD-GYP domain-containing protein [Oceanospirillum sediminis]|uniref:HD domain-containing protein n=1 Tax=Oceanospirillum sediminis TaxID=2760088 RepID=A0A839IVT4_9GAMM|nr:HD domain-containing phosphohydrolase [Oceanospirillum sediminis]MBB1489543.1 HD domain-containing protein [Oceanospirillum sediminis]